MNEAKRNELSGVGEAGANLTELLNAVCCKVFDNEVSFMETCWQYGKDRNYWDELIEFYMAGERCRIAVLLPCGTTITDTVKTEDVLAWIEGI